jgi:hypothetical protein
MDGIHVEPQAGACAKGTLWGLPRAGALVMGAVLATILLVDLPVPIGRTADAPPYVPAAETWIEPGAASRPEAADRADESAPRPTLTAEKERPSRDRRDG